MSLLLQVPKKPYFQAAAAALICLTAGLVLKIVSNSTAVHSDGFWIIGASCLLFFTLLNTSFGMRADDMRIYWVQSIASFAGLILFSMYSAKLLSGVSIGQTKVFTKIYIVLIFCHLLFFSITMIIKRLWAFFESENEQKLRRDGLN
jgi:hypothetical protein